MCPNAHSFFFIHENDPCCIIFKVTKVKGGIAMHSKQLAATILTLLGGAENIETNMACMTRLRVGVRDLTRVDLEELKSLEDILGLVEADTLQVILGPEIAGCVLEEFSKLTGIPADSAKSDLHIISQYNKA